ncbi:MAG: dTMP kinase [Acidobacteriota bacterium]|nr:dTMP kinase [Acidobacteriota bacterium]
MPGPWFVTFEGLDGSGKSTHLDRIVSRLAELGESVCRTREPGGTFFGEELRELFLGPRAAGVDGRVELMLVFASRRQHLVEVIEPALMAGSQVLCDRFTDSTHAYQGSGRGVAAELIDQVDELATGRRTPDRTLLFDLPAETAYERGRSKRRRRRGDVDRLDDESLAFYQRVKGGFLARAQADPERFRIVASSGPRDETAAQVVAALADLFPDLGD